MMHAWLERLFNTGNRQLGNTKFGSIKLADHKALSNQQSVQVLKASTGTELVLPLQQHMGDKPELIVKSGDYVYKGQMLARADSTLSVPLHASTSGTITAIEARPIPHPSGLSDQCVILQADGLDDAGDCYLPTLPDYQQQDNEILRQRIRDAGIVGLGGAVFPAAIKLRVREHIAVDTLVINGAECEPYITCDEVLMRDKAEEILAGAQIMLHILRTDGKQQQIRCLIGIEDNKARATEVMRAAVAQLDDARIEVVVVPTQYPAGGEKQLIHTLTGKEVPSGGRPADIGVICHNVATARAIYRAVVLGEPLISRYVTVTGGGVDRPGNFEVVLGVKIQELMAATGACPPSPLGGGKGRGWGKKLTSTTLTSNNVTNLPPHPQPFPHQGGKGVKSTTSTPITMGGPMMGLNLHSDQIPVVKATNCILISNNTEKPATPLPCIRCGKCADHCPAGLLPQQLFWYAQGRDFAKAEEYALFDCIECGCCTYVCPSHIPLVDYYRFAKTEIRGQRADKAKAELARERHDFHNERLERAKRERAERLAKHKKKAQGAMAGDKKDAIQAALERAKAKKAQLAQSNPATNEETSNTTGSERRQRRARRHRTPDNTAPPTNEGPQA